MKFHDPNPTQEINLTLEAGDYKLDLRIETHGKAQLAFPKYHLTPQDQIRHMNIQFYEKGVNGQFKPTTVPVPEDE